MGSPRSPAPPISELRLTSLPPLACPAVASVSYALSLAYMAVTSALLSPALGCSSLLPLLFPLVALSNNSEFSDSLLSRFT